VHIFSHDSLGLGEDGPTHQPVEQLAGLRAIPNYHVIRPSDATETLEAWRVALEYEGPSALVLSRQALPVLDRNRLAPADGLRRGAYILWESSDRPRLVLIATGSEVSLALEAARRLADEGVPTRMVAMPCWELFREQPLEYREAVLPNRVLARVSVEAGSQLGWAEWTGIAGRHVAVDRFGASAKGELVLEKYGFNVENVMAVAREALRSADEWTGVLAR
jgi:transketolase